MHEWKDYSLREIVGAPISGSRPRGGVNEDIDGVPSLGGENILTTGGVTYKVLNRIPHHFFRSLPKGKLARFDVLINKDGAQTGKVGLYDGAFDQAAINEHLFILRSKDDVVDQRLLYYLLLLPATQKAISKRITGSAQPGLNSQFVDAVRIKIPREPEQQRRIAEILSTVDEAIQQTEALIAKTQQIKVGLMYDLFTRGVTVDGQLRPPREEAPQLYKESALGWIPKEWGVTKLGSLTSKKSDGEHLSPIFVEPGVPLVSAKDVHPHLLDFSKVRFITEGAALKALARCDPQQGDLLIVSRGATIGRVHRIRLNVRFVLMGSVIQVRPGQKSDGSYLEFFLRRSQTQDELVKTSGSSAQQAIYLAHIKNLPILRPPIREQEVIGKILNAADLRLAEENALKEKLWAIKLGLTTDLLTGRRDPLATNRPYVVEATTYV